MRSDARSGGVHAAEVAAGERFAFGANWRRFLGELDDRRIAMAVESLSNALGPTLAGQRFLDVGSGSGLFSLAAHRLGADVCSIDYDPDSVACTTELRRRYFAGGPAWEIMEASVLDRAALERLGRFDVVYAWGVLHHTGAMWQAIDNLMSCVEPGGRCYLALYNDQGRASRAWAVVKRLYNRCPAPLRWTVLGPAFVRLWGPTLARDLVRGQPLANWRGYSEASRRGMSPWRDVVDWVGGWPFEVASPAAVFDFFRGRGCELRYLTTCAGGLGCNEFVFETPHDAPPDGSAEPN